MKNKNVLPILCCIVGNVIWGFSYPFIRTALDYAASEQLLAHRFIISTLMMLLPMLFQKLRFTVRGKTLAPFRNASISFKGKPLGGILVLVLMQLNYYFFETNGVNLTNSTFAGMVLAAVPIPAVLAGALFLKEYPSTRQALFCLVPIAGIVLMTLSANELGVITPLGVVCLLCCMIGSAIYKVANRKTAEYYTSYERTFLLLIVPAAVFSLVSLSSFGWDLRAFLAPLAELPYTLSVVFLSLLCSIAANLLVNYSAGYMSVFKLASFGALSTLVSTIMGVLVLDEPVSAMLLLGAAMILVGVQQVIRPDKKQLKIES